MRLNNLNAASEPITDSHIGIEADDGVSVCIPCYNSAGRIRRTLEHLQAQTRTKGIDWEVIVVDNASTDDTAEVARKVWSSREVAPLRIVNESKPGLSHARLRAFHESRYTIIAFLDDDNWACDEWVALVYEIMAQHPEIGALGGRGEPAIENGTVPDWFWRFSKSYAIGPQSDSSGPLAGRGCLYGAGLAIRKSAWAGLVSEGFRSYLSGRSAGTLSSGEDSELCFAMRLSGWTLWYDSRLVFHHFLPQSRLQWDYLERLTRALGNASIWSNLYAQHLPSQADGSRLAPFLPVKLVRSIRASWLFQVYAAIRGICGIRAERNGRNQDSQRSLDSTVQMSYYSGRLQALLGHPLRYLLLSHRIKRARFRRI